MDKQTCQTCVHFHQHYSLKNGKVTRVFCGHCIFPKVKSTRPYTKACENYALGSSDIDAFADRQYLTKEMIRHLFELEFLPSIENASNDD